MYQRGFTCSLKTLFMICSIMLLCFSCWFLISQANRRSENGGPKAGSVTCTVSASAVSQCCNSLRCLNVSVLAKIGKSLCVYLCQALKRQTAWFSPSIGVPKLSAFHFGGNILYVFQTSSFRPVAGVPKLYAVRSIGWCSKAHFMRSKAHFISCVVYMDPVLYIFILLFFHHVRYLFCIFLSCVRIPVLYVRYPVLLKWALCKQFFLIIQLSAP